MNRRDFLSYSSLATLALTLPRSARADTGGPSDRLWFFLDANGAWDPTFFCDPKPVAGFVSQNVFTAADLLTNSYGLTYAPMESGAPYQTGGQDFFQKYADRMLVLNGLDCQTNNHNVGSRHKWSGKLGAGNPSLGALIAGIHAEVKPSQLPLAFLSTGGFDQTEGLTTATRVATTAPLLKLTYPNRFKVDEPNTFYHHEEAMNAIRAAQDERTARLISEQGLPQIAAGLQRLEEARATEGALEALKEKLGSNLLPSVGSNDSVLLPAARTALAAMSAGICVSANLSLRGFDTHSNHDTLVSNLGGQRLPLQSLFVTIDYIWDRAAALGLADKIVMVVGSDFGRTRYNNPNVQQGDGAGAAGKDHWPITSAMLIGSDIPPGVIGLTEVQEGLSGVVAKNVMPVGNDVVTTDDPAAFGGPSLLRPVHLHHALRCLAGIKNHPIATRYPVHRPGDLALPLLPDAPGWESFT